MVASRLLTGMKALHGASRRRVTVGLGSRVGTAMKPRHAAALTLVSCTAQKQFVQEGGTQAEGYVVVSSESDQSDREQVLKLTTSKCVGWGYKGALQYGEFMKCEAASHGRLFGPFELCYRDRLFIQYHCQGANILPPG
jgi:hypothetical protein